MAEDIAFRIQLGIILPKLKDKLAGDLSEIVEELVTVVQAGTRNVEDVSLDEVKTLIMKDLEIFLDDAIFPPIEAKLKPPQESVAEVEEPAAEEEEEVKPEE